MPGIQDFKDIVAHNKWFFGKGPKPQFDRWTYWEKFDYMAVFWGVAMIGASGLVMWFPEFFTKVLPGWAINVALIIHSDEALLAAGFIFTFHFFNVHFRPDKFPMDRVMFSGRMTKSEMLNERKKLYDRWVEEGTLDQHRAGDEWHSWKKIALPAGFIAFMFGVALMVMIYIAMAKPPGGRVVAMPVVAEQRSGRFGDRRIVLLLFILLLFGLSRFAHASEASDDGIRFRRFCGDDRAVRRF